MSTYRIGTVTVNNGSTSATGSGTAWISVGIRAGDFLFVNGLFAEIASVQSNTALTLVRGWPGSTASGQQYSIALIDDAQRSIASLNQVLAALGSGNLTSLAALSAGANQMPYFTGAGAMALTNLTAAARAILGLAGSSGAKVPVVTASGAAALRDIVGTVSQSGGVPTGAIIQRGSNANGEFVRFADGTQICVSNDFTGVDVTTTVGSIFRAASPISWTFPASFVAVAGVAGAVTSMGNSQTHWGSIRVLSSTAADISVFAPGSAANRTVRAMAVGRWFQ